MPGRFYRPRRFYTVTHCRLSVEAPGYLVPPRIMHAESLTSACVARALRAWCPNGVPTASCSCEARYVHSAFIAAHGRRGPLHRRDVTGLLGHAGYPGASEPGQLRVPDRPRLFPGRALVGQGGAARAPAVDRVLVTGRAREAPPGLRAPWSRRRLPDLSPAWRRRSRAGRPIAVDHR